MLRNLSRKIGDLSKCILIGQIIPINDSITISSATDCFSCNVVSLGDEVDPGPQSDALPEELEQAVQKAEAELSDDYEKGLRHLLGDFRDIFSLQA